MGPRLCLATALEATNVVYWSTVVKFLASEVIYSCSVVIFIRHAFNLNFGKIVLSLRFCEYTKNPFYPVFMGPEPFRINKILNESNSCKNYNTIPALRAVHTEPVTRASV